MTELKPIGLFIKQMHTWQDPWGKETSESVLQLLQFKPEFVRQPNASVNNGYETYPAARIEIPGVGVFTRMENRIDYTGGSWWGFANGTNTLGYRVHDANTARHESARFLDAQGHPVTKAELFG